MYCVFSQLYAILKSTNARLFQFSFIDQYDHPEDVTMITDLIDDEDTKLQLKGVNRLNIEELACSITNFCLRKTYFVKPPKMCFNYIQN